MNARKRDGLSPIWASHGKWVPWQRPQPHLDFDACKYTHCGLGERSNVHSHNVELCGNGDLVAEYTIATWRALTATANSRALQIAQISCSVPFPSRKAYGKKTGKCITERLKECYYKVNWAICRHVVMRLRDYGYLRVCAVQQCLAAPLTGDNWISWLPRPQQKNYLLGICLQR